MPQATGGSPVEGWAEVRDLRVRYLDWGGDGPPVLALHGLASSAHWFDLVAPLLRDRYRIVAPDQRGHGQTTQAPGGYDWRSLSSDAVSLMDHLGTSRAVVMGHSWGANVAINVAAEFPDRVDSLMLIEGGFFTPRLGVASTWEQFSARLAPRTVSGTRDDYLEQARAQLSICWSAEVERIVQTMVYEDASGEMQDILRPANQAQVIRAMWDEPAADTWPRIACRTLIVAAGASADRADTEFAVMRRRMVEAAAQAIRDVEVRWIPETIHDIGYHKPAELADIIRGFLK